MQCNTENVQLILLNKAKVQLVNTGASLDTAAAKFESMISILRSTNTDAEIFDPMIARLLPAKYETKQFAWSVRRISDQITEAIKSE